MTDLDLISIGAKHSTPGQFSREFTEEQWISAARAIEAAATAPLLERIAALEAKLAQQADPMSRIAKSKLADLIADGYRECGVMIERASDDGSVMRGAVSNGGMVIWWHPAQQAEAQEPVAWIVAGANMTGGVSEYLSWTKTGAGQVKAPLVNTPPRPLFTRPQPAQLQRLSEEETMAAWRGVDDAGDDKRNAILYGDAIQSAIAAKNGAELK